GPLLGGHDAAVGLAQRVGAISDNALRPDLDFTEPLAQHRFYRIPKELFHHADLTSLHELLPSSSFHRRGALLLPPFGAERLPSAARPRPLLFAFSSIRYWGP